MASPHWPSPRPRPPSPSPAPRSSGTTPNPFMDSPQWLPPLLRPPPWPHPQVTRPRPQTLHGLSPLALSKDPPLFSKPHPQAIGLRPQAFIASPNWLPPLLLPPIGPTPRSPGPAPKPFTAFPYWLRPPLAPPPGSSSLRSGRRSQLRPGRSVLKMRTQLSKPQSSREPSGVKANEWGEMSSSWGGAAGMGH